MFAAMSSETPAEARIARALHVIIALSEIGLQGSVAWRSPLCWSSAQAAWVRRRRCTLAAAGVGTIGLVDHDRIEPSATCSARFCTPRPKSAAGRLRPHGRACRHWIRSLRVVAHEVKLSRRQCRAQLFGTLRGDPRRHRPPRHALSRSTMPACCWASRWSAPPSIASKGRP